MILPPIEKLSPILEIEQLKLKRYPLDHDLSLKAYNAADEYLIAYAQSLNIEPNANILILNDQFGALSCSFSKFHPDYWTDSYLSKQAILRNLKNNRLDYSLRHINQCSEKLNPKIKYDYLLIRIPKHNSLLEFQLETVSQHLHQDTQIIATGMTKEIHNSQLKIFEKIIGNTRTSLAKKKARLIFSSPDIPLKNFDHSEFAEQSIKSYAVNNLNLTAFGYPGVFARDSLDQGARVMLRYLPELEAGQKLMDLGCGNGILGSAAAKQNSAIEVSFSDESWLAIESAKKTFTHNLAQENKPINVRYHVTDVLDNVSENNFDAILCNPPFHQQNSQTLSIAKKMFADSARKLHPEGQLRVVANRHLQYANLLRKYFTQVTSISKDPKFIVWLAEKPLQKNSD